MNAQIYEEATEWLVEFRTEQVDHTARKRFERWLSTSPEHVRAYLEVSGVWEVASTQPPAGVAKPQDIDSLIERATASGTNVSALPREIRSSAAADGPGTLPHASQRTGGLHARRGALLGLAASVLLAITGIGAYLYAQRGSYTTDIGEQRSILLADGSTIDLNARSRVRVRFVPHERRIELLEGQALFRVAKDATRPFIVDSNGTRVRAVGTQFDVNQRKRGTIVTVVEGTVAVMRDPPTNHARKSMDPAATSVGLAQGRSPRGSIFGTQLPIRVASSDEILLTAGDQAVLTGELPLKARRTDIVTATAWTQRRLIFDSTPLDEVAEEFNRNNARPLVIEGAGLEDFHISGAFSSSDPEPLLRFLRSQSGLRVTAHSDRIVVARTD